MISPTSATTRAITLGAIGLLAALVFRRLDVALLIAPLLVWAAYAVASRPATAVPAPSPRPTLVIQEDDEAALDCGVTTSLPLVTVDWPPMSVGELSPRRGTITDLGATPRASLRAQHWGQFVVGPAFVVQSDPLGAWVCAGSGPATTVIVQPSTTTLHGPAAVLTPTGMAGTHRSAATGDGTDIAEVREFRQGDRLRRINWRVTSRTGQVHVTTTMQERDTNVLVVIDTLDDIASPDPTAGSSLSTQVRAATAIARHYLSVGDRVGLHDVGGLTPHLRTGTGPLHARRIVEALSRVPRDVSTHHVVSPVRDAMPGSMVFVCSALTARGTDAEIERLHRLGAHVIFVDCFPHVGDGTSPMEVSVSLENLRRAHRLDRLRDLGIPVVPWRGPGSLATLMLDVATPRARVRR